MERDGDDTRIERSPDDDEHIGVCIARAVADANAADLSELDATLNEILDPDALDRLFAPRPNGAPRDGGTVTFEIAGCRVTVGPDRTVVVRTGARA